MSIKLNDFDEFLAENGPAAIVIRENLMPVEGYDGVIFPPTFMAAKKGGQGGYNIDPPPTEDEPWKEPNVCLIDTVGSQANRIEPIFTKERYVGLVPQIAVTIDNENHNLLEIGHRAGDAMLRNSALGERLQEAFLAIRNRDNFELLAKVAPTSLVFGVWDSRATHAKVPRLVSSTIRAFNVRKLTRAAGYIPPVDYAEMGVFSQEEKEEAEKEAEKNPDAKSSLSQLGFVRHPPSKGAHGGVIATGGIRRDATLSLAALQLIKAVDPDRTLALRRYILGLSLVAVTSTPESYLRQGCNLVLDPDNPGEKAVVNRDGRRDPLDTSHEEAIEYAALAAEAFEPSDDLTVPFHADKARAEKQAKDRKKEEDKNGKGGTKKKATKKSAKKK